MQQISNGNIELVELMPLHKGLKPTPHCKKHGAMNKVSKDGVWRCISSAGYRNIKNGNSLGKLHIENLCNAACLI